MECAIKHTIVKLFKPYVVCVIVWISALMIFELVGVHYDWSGLFEKILKGMFWSVLPNSWYVWVLFYFVCFFVLAYRFRNKYFRILVLISLVSVYYVCARFVFDWGFSRWYSVWAFPVGCVYSENEDKLLGVLNKFKLWYVVTIGLMFLGVIVGYGNVPLINVVGHNILGVAIILVFYFYKVPNSRIFSFFGKISYEAYLVHGAIFGILCHLIYDSYASIVTLSITPIIAYTIQRLTKCMV